MLKSEGILPRGRPWRETEQKFQGLTQQAVASRQVLGTPVKTKPHGDITVFFSGIVPVRDKSHQVNCWLCCCWCRRTMYLPLHHIRICFSFGGALVTALHNFCTTVGMCHWTREEGYQLTQWKQTKETWRHWSSCSTWRNKKYMGFNISLSIPRCPSSISRLYSLSD